MMCSPLINTVRQRLELAALRLGLKGAVRGCSTWTDGVETSRKVGCTLLSCILLFYRYENEVVRSIRLMLRVVRPRQNIASLVSENEDAWFSTLICVHM